MKLTHRSCVISTGGSSCDMRRSAGQCVEYTGSAWQGDQCPTSGLVGLCATQIGSSLEAKFYFYSDGAGRFTESTALQVCQSLGETFSRS